MCRNHTYFVNLLDIWCGGIYSSLMATTTTKKETAMTRKTTTIDDLAAAIEWMNSYDRDDTIDAMADSLMTVIAYLQADIASRYAKRLERETILDLKADGKALTSAGKTQLRKICALKGEAFAATIAADADRGSLLPS